MKNQATLSGKDYKGRYEPIIYGRFNDNFFGVRFKQEDIWEVQRTLKNDLHPTMKPIPLIEKALINSSERGMKILDLFLGSGSTLIAAEKTGRKCYGMELDPKYVDVIVQRYVDYVQNPVVKLNGNIIIWNKTKPNTQVVDPQ
jgi:DNA modification methylase